MGPFNLHKPAFALPAIVNVGESRHPGQVKPVVCIVDISVISPRRYLGNSGVAVGNVFFYLGFLRTGFHYKTWHLRLSKQ